jgi:hypothetical protein
MACVPAFLLVTILEMKELSTKFALVLSGQFGAIFPQFGALFPGRKRLCGLGFLKYLHNSNNSKIVMLCKLLACSFYIMLTSHNICYFKRDLTGLKCALCVQQ